MCQTPAGQALGMCGERPPSRNLKVTLQACGKVGVNGLAIGQLTLAAADRRTSLRTTHELKLASHVIAFDDSEIGHYPGPCSCVMKSGVGCGTTRSLRRASPNANPPTVARRYRRSSRT